jgi:kinesin family protein C2/C3
MQQKALQVQEELFLRAAEREGLQIDLEQAEAQLSVKDAQHRAKTEALEQQLAQALKATAESGSKVQHLHSTVRSLRAQVTELGEVMLHHTAAFTKQLSEAQTFMTQALQVQANLQTTMSKYKKEMSERRKLHNLVQELRGNIRVYARARPLSDAEANAAATYAVTIPPADEAGEPSTELQLESAKGKINAFQFDAVFGPESTQSGVFAQIVSLVTSVLDGYNVCLFAYGQTGAVSHTRTLARTVPFTTRLMRRCPISYAAHLLISSIRVLFVSPPFHRVRRGPWLVRVPIRV